MFTYFVVYLFTDEPWKFNFEVKFYPPDPAQLQEDITRFVISGIKRAFMKSSDQFTTEMQEFDLLWNLFICIQVL